MRLFNKYGFRKVRGKDEWRHENGWTIRTNSRSITFFPAHEPHLKNILREYAGEAAKGNKIPRKVETAVLESIVSSLAETKTQRIKRRQLRAKQAGARSKRKKLPKRPWCRGCDICPEGTDSKVCSLLAYSTATAHWYCTSDEFYNRFWCLNARVQRGENDASMFVIDCSVYGGHCRYNTSITPFRSYPGLGYKDCPEYKEGGFRGAEAVCDSRGRDRTVEGRRSVRVRRRKVRTR